MTEQSKLLSVDEVAEWLHVSRSKVFELLREKGLPHIDMGTRTLRFDASDVAAWLEKQKQSA
jgi:excisionase family DNA binding protein